MSYAQTTGGDTNPYLIAGPALISFSGGRTSAYMLRMILDAHGGTLPDDVHVCFANTGKERFVTICPLAKAGVTARDIAAFWKEQPFDLDLMPHEGNCDLCFLKGRGKRAEIIRTRPDLADWWAEAEAGAKCSMPSGARFHRDESVEMLRKNGRAQHMFDFNEGSDPEDEHDAECGTWCTGEEA